MNMVKTEVARRHSGLPFGAEYLVVRGPLVDTPRPLLQDPFRGKPGLPTTYSTYPAQKKGDTVWARKKNATFLSSRGANRVGTCKIAPWEAQFEPGPLKRSQHISRVPETWLSGVCSPRCCVGFLLSLVVRADSSCQLPPGPREKRQRGPYSSTMLAAMVFSTLPQTAQAWPASSGCVACFVACCV